MTPSAPGAAVSEIADCFALLPKVEAVALGGSRTTNRGDARSDVDLYVYSTARLPLDERREIARRFSTHPEIGNTAFEPGDEWVDDTTGLRVDVTYRTLEWIEAQLDAVLVEHRASVGYSTCFWWNVRTSAVLFDRTGWLAGLKRRADAPYPEPLRRAIVAKNHPLLRTAQSQFLYQVERAIERNDPVAVQHRTTALLASYFDVLFAVNCVPHPGEKRLLAWAEALCPRQPEGMADDILAIVRASTDRAGGAQLLRSAHRMLDRLDQVLRVEGLLPTGQP
jgi:predicted nucleotidyltransferase